MAAITGLTISLEGITGKTVNIEWSYGGISNSKRTDVFAGTWTANKTVTYSAASQVSSFAYRIQYSIKVGSTEKWFTAEEVSSYDKASQKYNGKYRVQYTAPENAYQIIATVWMYSASYSRGVRSAKKVKKTKKKKAYKYTATNVAFFSTVSSAITYSFGDVYPEKPSSPSLAVDGANLKTTFTSNDQFSKKVQFEIYTGGVKEKNSDWLNVPWPVNTVEHIFTSLLSGKDYYARVRASNSSGTMIGEWSDMSSPIRTVPGIPQNFKAEAMVDERIKLDWDDVEGISIEGGYTIEYTNFLNNFDASSDVSSVQSNISEYYMTGLESGYTWYFRIKANNENGSSPWSEIIEQVVAKVPQPPSTWTLSTNIMVGEDATLYWTHNAEDGSKMTAAKIWYSINGVEQPEIDYPAQGETIPTDTSIYRYKLDVSQYSEGAVVLWKIKTKGAHPDFGDYSTERQLKIFGEPSISITSEDILTGFPYNITLVSGPAGQTPVGYSMTIVANDIMESEDALGNPIYIYPGQEIWSQYYVTDENPLEISLEPKDISVVSGYSYLLRAEVIMDSGLNAISEKEITVSIDTVDSFPTCDIGFNYGYYVSTLIPISYKDSNVVRAYIAEPVEGDYGYDHITLDASTFLSQVSNALDDYYFIYNNGSWYLNEEPVSMESYGLNVDFSPEGDFSETPYHITVTVDNEPVLDDNVTLDLYRIDSDGTFIELVTGLENTGGISVMDPHPALSTCRYRVISRNKFTGKLNYEDVEIEVDEPIILIQWDEKDMNIVTDYDDSTESDDTEEYLWSGTILELPYNITTSESNSLDVSLVEYIGRRHPVSYYGTQVGSSINYSTSIERDDEYTLNYLRELQYYRGDVHVRDPYGNSYWANVSVSFNMSYNELTIPVNITAKRVESDKI